MEVTILIRQKIIILTYRSRKVKICLVTAIILVMILMHSSNRNGFNYSNCYNSKNSLKKINYNCNYKRNNNNYKYNNCINNNNSNNYNNSNNNINNNNSNSNSFSNNNNYLCNFNNNSRFS
jgi:hypothetical protein